ncbi:MAG: 2-octaprenyl-6-methoxyphenol hydroxylase [Alphaproteobacteria bacterium]|nr:2-octaprenyl-6-methoxyphenol hydroxylase [Alphaproteobacteria bacterium]
MARESGGYDVAVVGGGPAGLTAAVALAGAGVSTALVGGRPARSDNRTTALLAGSVTALDAVGVWARCRTDAAALRVMRIVDDTDRLWRAPEVRFDAAEIGLEAFGWNIENRHLVAALRARAGEIPALVRIDDDAGAIAIGDDDVTVSLAGGGALTARVVVGADGRRSICRAAAGIETERQRYPQTALTFSLTHARPHRDISTEFHTPQGPFTLVPLPGLRSSLVCVVAPDEAERIGALDAAGLDDEIERRSHSILGKIKVERGHGAFPLGVETARRFAARRIALIGEAGHVMPPIGAQGLNLGLRDAATISELVVAARRAGQDIGGTALTDEFDRLRRADVTGRAVAVDLLNRSLLSDFLPMQGARGLGLWLLDRIGPLRRAMMREGVGPAARQPRLMRGEAL